MCRTAGMEVTCDTGREIRLNQIIVKRCVD
nr:MAG TPA: hypothetical protein [Caudoviricetes sp.]